MNTTTTQAEEVYYCTSERKTFLCTGPVCPDCDGPAILADSIVPVLTDDAVEADMQARNANNCNGYITESAALKIAADYNCDYQLVKRYYELDDSWFRIRNKSGDKITRHQFIAMVEECTTSIHEVQPAELYDAYAADGTLPDDLNSVLDWVDELSEVAHQWEETYHDYDNDPDYSGAILPTRAEIKQYVKLSCAGVLLVPGPRIEPDAWQDYRSEAFARECNR